MERDALRAIIAAHTKPGSRHKAAALVLLDSHLKRGYTPENKVIRCSECQQLIEIVRWTENGTIVDSWGYIEELPSNRCVCHRCLNEGWLGDILSPSSSQ